MRYLFPTLLFLANSEILSMLAMVIIVTVFLLDLAKEAAKRG